MKKTYPRSNVVTVMIGGATVPIAVDALKLSQFTPHHGKALSNPDKEINSLHSVDIGNKTIVRTRDGRSHVYDTDEHDLMSAQRLAAKGFQIIPPSASVTS